MSDIEDRVSKLEWRVGIKRCQAAVREFAGEGIRKELAEAFGVAADTSWVDLLASARGQRGEFSALVRRLNDLREVLRSARELKAAWDSCSGSNFRELARTALFKALDAYATLKPGPFVDPDDELRREFAGALGVDVAATWEEMAARARELRDSGKRADEAGASRDSAYKRVDGLSSQLLRIRNRILRALGNGSPMDTTDTGCLLDMLIQDLTCGGGKALVEVQKRRIGDLEYQLFDAAKQCETDAERIAELRTKLAARPQPIGYAYTAALTDIDSCLSTFSVTLHYTAKEGYEPLYRGAPPPTVAERRVIDVAKAWDKASTGGQTLFATKDLCNAVRALDSASGGAS